MNITKNVHAYVAPIPIRDIAAYMPVLVINKSKNINTIV